MFENQLGLRENPFVAGHHPKFVYPSREHQEALAHLRFGIENREPFVLITGEVGTGKTTAIYDALSGWGNRATVALITNSRLTRDELIEEICLRFGVLVAGGISKPQAMVQLERHLLGLRARDDLAILLLDEAQNLERDQLEEIRLISNLEHQGQKLLQIFLVGQPELEAKLQRPELRQLRQRIVIHYRLNPLTAEETERYIHHRVSVAGGNAQQLFPTATCREIHRITHGIPREINTVAGQSLITAYVGDSSSVRPEHVSSVAEDGGFRSVLAPRDGAPPASAPAPPPATEPPPPPNPAPAAVATPVAPLTAPPPPVDASPAGPATAPIASPQPVPLAAPVAMPISLPPAAHASTPAPSYSAATSTPPPPPVVAAPPRAALDDRSAAPGSPPVPAGATPAGPVYTAPDSPTSTDTIPRDAEEPKVNDDPKKPGGGPEQPSDVKMPAWLDEVLEKRKQVDAQMASERERAQGGGSTPPPKPATPPAAAAPPKPAAPAPAAASASKPGSPDRIAPHPADPKPAATGAAGAKPGYAPSPYISPRLRDKLMTTGEGGSADIDFEIKKSSPLPMIITGVVVLGLIVGGVMFMRSRGSQQAAATPSPAPVADTAATATTADSAAGAATGATTPPAGATAGGTSTTPPPAAKPSPAPAASRPATKPRPATPTGGATAGATAGGGAAAAPASSRKYGIEVGSYLNPDRANSEKDRLATATGLSAQVVTANEDGGEVFKVVLGSFSGRAAADKKATELIGASTVSEARVVPVK